eukprot:scaffold19245_cov199-Amphora_coffeaeformis.AAC.20
MELMACNDNGFRLLSSQPPSPVSHAAEEASSSHRQQQQSSVSTVSMQKKTTTTTAVVAREEEERQEDLYEATSTTTTCRCPRCPRPFGGGGNNNNNNNNNGWYDGTPLQDYAFLWQTGPPHGLCGAWARTEGTEYVAMALWIGKDWSWSQLRWTVTAYACGTAAASWIVWTHVWQHVRPYYHYHDNGGSGAICYSELYKGTVVTLWLTGLYAWMMGDLWDLWMAETIASTSLTNVYNENGDQDNADDDEKFDWGQFLARWILLSAVLLFTLFFLVLVPLDVFKADRKLPMVQHMQAKSPPCPPFWYPRCAAAAGGGGGAWGGGRRREDAETATIDGVVLTTAEDNHNNNNNSDDDDDDYVPEFRIYASLHFYTWVLKDCMWAWELPLAYFAAFLLTICLNVDLLCRFARHGRNQHQAQLQLGAQQRASQQSTTHDNTILTNDVYIDFWNYVVILLWVVANGLWAFGELVANAAATQDQFRRYTWPQWQVIHGATFQFRYAAGWVFLAAALVLTVFYTHWMIRTLQKRLPQFETVTDDHQAREQLLEDSTHYHCVIGEEGGTQSHSHRDDSESNNSGGGMEEARLVRVDSPVVQTKAEIS